MRMARSADDLRQPCRPRRCDQFDGTNARAQHSDPCSVGDARSACGVVSAGGVEPPVTIAHAQRIGTSIDTGNVHGPEAVGRQRVHQRPRVTHATRRNHQGEELIQERGRRRNRECGHVLIRAQRALRGKPSDVGWTVKAPVAFQLDVGRVVLTDADQAGTAGRHDLRSPIGVPHPATWQTLRAQASVDHRDEVRVGERVQNVAWPRSVDAREHDIEVERCLHARRLAHALFEQLVDGLLSRRRVTQYPPSDVDLGTAQERVQRRRPVQPIQVDELGPIEVHHADVLDSGSSEALDDLHADTSRSGHEHTQPREERQRRVDLRLFAVFSAIASAIRPIKAAASTLSPS